MRRGAALRFFFQCWVENGTFCAISSSLRQGRHLSYGGCNILKDEVLPFERPRPFAIYLRLWTGPVRVEGPAMPRLGEHGEYG